MEQHSRRPGPSFEDSNMVEPAQDLLFTDFVNVDMPDVLDSVELSQDCLFIDFVNVDMCVAPTRLP